MRMFETFRFCELVDFVCMKWRLGNSEVVSLKYKLSGYSKVMLDCEDDFINMIKMSKMMNVK